MPSKLAWNILARVGLAEDASEGEPNASAPAATTSPQVTSPMAPSPFAAPIPAPAPQIRSHDDAKVRELDISARKTLVDALAKDDATFFEDLVDTLETLKDAIPDEVARYRAALKLMSKKGVEVGALLNDYDKSIGTLEKVHRQFGTDMKAQSDLRVGSKRRSVEELTQKISTLNQQLEMMRTQIAELVSQRDTEQSGISIEENKVTLVQQRFEMAYQAIRHEIESQRAKIAQYGQAS